MRSGALGSGVGLRPLRSLGRVGGKGVRADLVRPHLRYGSAADHDLDLVAHAGVGELLDDVALLVHGGGQQSGEADDVGVVLVDGVDELRAVNVAAEVDDFEVGAAHHKRNEVLADVVQVALNGADDGGAELGGLAGADTTAVLLGVPEEGVHLAVDLGTNGEIAVGNARDGFLTSSTACGPALEGGNIECGMRGSEGAIDHADITPDGELRFHVLGEGEAKGLCGSGIIDMTAALVRCGLVDMTGRLLPRDEFAAEYPDSPLLGRLEPVGEYNNAFFLTRSEHPVYLSQEDIRQIQLAKSSICAGCLTLCHEHGIEPVELDSLILAGAFGNYIDVDNALYIGLLPAAPRDRVVAVGNGAGSGVCRYLRDRAESARCEHIRAVTHHVELNASAEFMEQYIMNMNFNVL